MPLVDGSQLGPYLIESRIGAGGMGEVYKAHDPRLSRDVAIKILPPHLSDDAAARERFATEMRAIAALSHANILAIHDIGESSGAWYAVMELIEGRSLRDRLRAGALTLDEALEYAVQIVRAMVAAHAKGVAHGDLKPDNVMITPDGLVKLVDFGIASMARAAEGEDADATRLIDADLIIGSPGYLSPEQARGHRPEPRSDIFSFGATLYEMLTGTRAFQGATAADLTSAVLRDDPVRVSLLASAVGPALDDLVHRCLEKRPGARFQTAVDLLAGLDHARAEASGSRSSAVPRTGAVLPDAAPSVAVLPFADLSPEKDQEYFCDGMADELINALARVPGLSVASRTSAFQFKGRSDDVRQIGAKLGVAHVLEGSVRKAGQRLRVTVQLAKASDGYQLWSERFDRDVADVFAVQDEIAQTVVRTLEARFGAATPTLVRRPTDDLEAYSLYLQGRHYWNRRTSEATERSLTFFRQAIDRDGRFAQAFAGLADAYVTLALTGRNPAAATMPQAREAAVRALEMHPDLADAHASLASVRALYDWAWTDAEAEFRHAPDHHWHAMHVMVPLGRFDQAIAELQRARPLDPLSLPLHASLARTLYFAGRYDEALIAIDRAIDLDATFAMAHLFRGDMLVERGAWSEALAAYDTAARLSGRHGDILSATGYATALAGDAGQARAIARELEALAAGTYVTPVLQARIQVGLGEIDLALDTLDRAAGERATHLAWIGVHPSYARLHGHPRFDALLGRIGLPR